MEAVAAVSSIAGILSLVGQTLNGIIILRGLFKDCESASKSITSFLKRINDLIQCLQDVQELMKKLEESPSKAVSDTILASLQIQLDDCSKDMYMWLKIGRDLIPDSSTGTKAVFKKFLVALEKQKVKDIYEEISAHKDNINTKLSVIGRCFDIEHSTTLDTLSNKFDFVFGGTAAPAYPDWSQPVPPNYETISRNGSSCSLMSIAESLARIETRMQDFVSTGRPAAEPQRGPAAWASTDLNDSQYCDLEGGAQYNYEAYRSTMPQLDRTMTDVYADELYNPSFSTASEKYKCRIPACKDLQFSSTALLSRHELMVHDMHILGDKYFICTFEDCERSVPSNGFMLHWMLRDHMKQVHDPSLSSFEKADTPPVPDELPKPSKSPGCEGNEGENTTKPLDVVDTLLNQYSILLQGTTAHLSTDVKKYIELTLLVELASLKVNVLKKTPWIMSDVPRVLVKHEIQQLDAKLQDLKSSAALLRSKSWNVGFNMQDLDDYISIAKQPEAQHQPPEDDTDTGIDVGMPTFFQPTTPANTKHTSLSLQPQTLDPNSSDRINLWLLHNLSTSPEQQQLHRSFLPTSPAKHLTEEQWARQVLKYWLLDDAATGATKHGVESTNGAVDSAGQCHSARVLIASHQYGEEKPEHGVKASGEMKHKRKREREGERESGREKDRFVVDATDVVSTTASLPFRWKKRKYAESV